MVHLATLLVITLDTRIAAWREQYEHNRMPRHPSSHPRAIYRLIVDRR
jgi:hypothetical protein